MLLRWPDLNVLALLVAIDDTGSLSAASKKESIAQPNASRAIKAFERQCGFQLVQRSARGSTLTPQGAIVAHWARVLLDDARRLQGAVTGLREQHSADLVVGASMTVAEHLMPRWLGAFRQEQSGVTVHLTVQNSERIFDLVSDGTCAVGFVESPSVPASLHSVVVARDKLVVAVDASHPWAHRERPLSIAELADTALVVREPGSGTRTTLDRALKGMARAAPILELGSAAAIRTSVIAGVGPAVLSTLAIAEQVRAGELVTVEVDGLDLGRELRACWRSTHRLDGPAGELLGLIRKLRI